jgi:Carboxypeptidase regulatory-like domain
MNITGAIMAIMATAVLADAQDTERSAQRAASIGGTVRDADTRTPVQQATLGVVVNGEQILVETDSAGHYAFQSLPPGLYIVSAAGDPKVYGAVRHSVVLAPGQKLTTFDFSLTSNVSVSGTVTDENKHPVPGATVWAIRREYQFGFLRYFQWIKATTNDKGEFVLNNLQPGRGYLIRATIRTIPLDADSREPVDLEQRKHALAPVYYPNSPSPDGGTTITLGTGERRHGVDIVMPKQQAYCLEGEIQAQGAPQRMSFELIEDQPANGAGSYTTPPSGLTSADGRFRVCGLFSGKYQINAWSRDRLPQLFASASFWISREDIRDFRLNTIPGLSLPGEVVIDGAPPDLPVAGETVLELLSLTRMAIHHARSPVPGAFQFDNIAIDEYTIRYHFPPGLYVKDTIYNGQSITGKPLRVGTAIGTAPLRIVLGKDGASLTVVVHDKDGNPVPDMTVVSVPANQAAEASAVRRGDRLHQSDRRL